MERRAALVLAALALAVFPARGGTQQADFCRQDALGDTRPETGAYARRNGGYCDGAVFQVNSGQGELPVIGVSASTVVGDPKLQAVSITALKLSQGPAGISWPLHLQGVAKSPKRNYRLDAALPSGSPLVIGPESGMVKVIPTLRAEDVAWSAWSDSSRNGRTYIPVHMPGKPGGAVEITVRPTIPIAYVVFSVKDWNGANVQAEQSIVDENPHPERGAPVTLVIPAGTPERVVVHVIAVGNDGESQTASIRLVRPGGAGQ